MSSTASDSLAPADWSQYAWKASPDDVFHYSRPAIGGELLEVFMNHYMFGQHNLFRGHNITSSYPMSTSDLISKVRNTWEVLRFQEPTIAMKTEIGEQGDARFTYRSVENLQTLREWSDRTVTFCEGETDLDEVRFQKGQKTIPDQNGDQTFLYIVARSSTSFGLLFHSNHPPFDGVGMRILFTKFFKIFASGIKSESLDWGTEAQNLAPCFLTILSETEVKNGPLYDNNLNTVVEDYFTGMKRRQGFKIRDLQPGPTRRHHIVLSVEETSRLLAGAKSMGYTLNVLAHAALCIMTHLENPKNTSTPTDAAYVFYGLVNSRHRLAPPYNGRDAYTGWCLGLSCLQIPVSLVAFSAAAGEKAQLQTVAEAMKAEYAKQKAFPSLLAIEPEMSNTMLNGGRLETPWMTPAFSGDGRGEAYMDRDYYDSEGNLIVSIDDFFPSVNIIDPGSSFRIWSWRDQMTLSVDYNTAVISAADIKEFVDNWVNILRRSHL